MADDEDDIVWIREDTAQSSVPTSPTTPATIIEAAPVLSDAFDKPILKSVETISVSNGPPEVTISAPPPTPPAAPLAPQITPMVLSTVPDAAPAQDIPALILAALAPEPVPEPEPEVEAKQNVIVEKENEIKDQQQNDQLSAKLDPKTPNSVDDNSMSFDISKCYKEITLY